MLLRYVDRNSAIPVNLTQFRPAGGQETLGSERDRIWRCAPSPWRDLLARLGGLRLGFHLAALDEVDLGIEDDHVTFLDAVAYFHLRSQIPCHGHFSDGGAPPPATAACRPSRLKMIASAGTRTDGVSCGT